MFTIIQDLQKNVGEMYWKANGGFGNHTENDTKWIEVSGIIGICFFHKYINIFCNYTGCGKSGNLYLIGKC